MGRRSLPGTGVMLVKTAGIKCWSDIKKCCGHILTYGGLPDLGWNLNPTPYISASAEVMIVWILEGYYWRWFWVIHQTKCDRLLAEKKVTKEEIDEHKNKGEATP